MRSVAITGISENVMEDLMKNRVRTVELRSPHNFFTVIDIEPGATVFITHSTANDITTGNRGIIAKVRERETIMHRVIEGAEGYYEEREALLARIQLELYGIGRIKSVEGRGLGKPTIVEYEEIKYFDAR